MELSKENLSKAERKLFKAQRRLEKINAELVKKPGNTDEKITVLCVKFGNKYGREYVERLRNMVARNITMPYEIVCLTDDQHAISGVKSILQKPAGYTKLWWHKVHMFDPSLDLHGKILYLDLDIVICGNLDKLIRLAGSGFYGIRDFNRKFYPSWNNLNSSVMCWTHGSENYVWNEFIKDKHSAMRMHGDQDWIWKVGKNRIKFWPNEWVQSYKWEIRSREELTDRTGRRGFKTVRSDVKPHPECCIAVFHGDPNPSDIQDTFVIDNWR